MAQDFSAQDYTRRIFVGGTDFTGVVDQCSFSWGECGGPHGATLKITTADFDETFGIRQGDDVDIRYGDAASTRMWRGIVTELATTVMDGLTIMAVGPKLMLYESVPDGLFGTLATTGPPLLLSATTSDAAPGAPGIQTDLGILVFARSIDADGTTDFTDTTADPSSPLGYPGSPSSFLSIAADTIAANKKLDISWNCGQNASGTEIQVVYDFLGPDQRIEYYDAVGDTLSIDGAFEPTEGTPFTASTTSREATIAGASVEDIVNHLLDKWLPSEFTKGTVDVGALDVDVDLFDLRGAGADLNQVLSTLRDIAGRAQWYVDASLAVHFVEEGTVSAKTFVIQSTPSKTLSPTDYDVLVGVSKKQLRDGITIVKVEGEEELENEHLEDDDPDWDNLTRPTTESPDFSPITSDARVFSIGVKKTGTPVIPVGSGKAWIDANYLTLQDWLDDFPNQRFLYLKKESLDTGFITRTLEDMRVKVIDPPDPFTPSGASAGAVGNRPRMVPVTAPGVSTILTAGIIANNFLLKRNPNPVQWAGVLEQVKTLFVPGQDRVTVVSGKGYEYVLPITGIDYQFGENISANLTLGDVFIGGSESVTMQERTVTKMSLQKQSKARWAT